MASIDDLRVLYRNRVRLFSDQAKNIFQKTIDNYHASLTSWSGDVTMPPVLAVTITDSRVLQEVKRMLEAHGFKVTDGGCSQIRVIFKDV